MPSECVRVTKTLPLSHTHMPQSSPLQELATGLRRMLSPPGPTQHHNTTVQQRVDDVPKWSVQMYYTGVLSTNCQRNLAKKTS